MFLLTLSLAALALGCRTVEEPEPGPTNTAPAFTGTPLYREVCSSCGATFTVYEVVQVANRDRFQIRLRIENTGQRGRQDFSAISSVAYGLDPTLTETFRTSFEREQRRGTAMQFLMGLRPPFHTFSHFLDARGSPSTPPDLKVGESWQGWLVYNGPLSPDTRALVLHIQSIETDAPGGMRADYGWISFAPGLPFIPFAPR